MVNLYQMMTGASDECYRWAHDGLSVELIEPQEEGPEIPAEVHNTRKVDADVCMAATRALCAGVK